ncbi:MAG: hypothetical protein FWC36_10575 [Spirochaetes bacterium]|nr:hypothetical protein [Spirochaetota bacterium]
MKSLLKITREEYIELRLESAREIGKEEGLAEGREKLLETARKFKAMGLSLEQIAEGVGLPIEEVEKL